jgi:hypothetical protein
MTNTVRINAAALNRPGVFVGQTSTGGLPQPIATHAVAYVFGTTQMDGTMEVRAICPTPLCYPTPRLRLLPPRTSFKKLGVQSLQLMLVPLLPMTQSNLFLTTLVLMVFFILQEFLLLLRL